MQMVANSTIATPDLPLAAATEFATAGNCVNMAEYHRCQIVLILDQAGAGTGTVTMLQAGDTAGSDEKALAYAEYWKNETGVTTNQLTLVTAATLTTAGASTTGLNAYVFEVKNDQLDIDNDFTYVRLNVASLSNNTAATLLYRLYEPRWQRGATDAPDAIS